MLHMWQFHEFDFYTEVEPGFANCSADSFEVQIAITFRIADDNCATTAPNQFVKTHIVKMAAVRKIYILLCIAGAPEQFTGEPQQTDARRICTAVDTPCIAQPPAKTNIKDRHEKCQGQAGVISHVRTGGGARYSHGAGNSNAA